MSPETDRILTRVILALAIVAAVVGAIFSLRREPAGFMIIGIAVLLFVLFLLERRRVMRKRERSFRFDNIEVFRDGTRRELPASARYEPALLIVGVSAMVVGTFIAAFGAFAAAQAEHQRGSINFIGRADFRDTTVGGTERGWMWFGIALVAAGVVALIARLAVDRRSENE